MVHNLIVHVFHVYTCTCTFKHTCTCRFIHVHVCTNGVEYGLQITYIEGPSSLFACVMTFAPPFMCMVIGDIYTIMSITACARRRIQICIRRCVRMYVHIHNNMIISSSAFFIPRSLQLALILLPPHTTCLPLPSTVGPDSSPHCLRAGS